mmetsp:Transcript_6077/g.17060  ORF Transcript_6077/g.17060 Transcript_6077/m.17060 type:complete len:553 (-) Transcript_6077:340-1998(-)
MCFHSVAIVSTQRSVGFASPRVGSYSKIFGSHNPLVARVEEHKTRALCLKEKERSAASQPIQLSTLLSSKRTITMALSSESSSSSMSSSSDAVVGSLTTMVNNAVEAAQESLGATVTGTLVGGPSQRAASEPPSSSSGSSASSSTTTTTTLSVPLLATIAGWGTSVVLGLWILQSWIAAQQKQPHSNGNNSSATTQERWWRLFTTQTLWRLLGLKTQQKEQKQDSKTVALHRGSCQCGAITFKLIPPRRVPLLEKYRHLGKQQYPAARVPADQLQLTSGKHLWSSYHVSSPQDGPVWAFSFCRVCSTQLLHATEADQSSLFVNVTCFKQVPEEEQYLFNNNVNINSKTKRSYKTQVSASGNDTDAASSTSQAWDDMSVGTTGTALPYFADPRLFSQPSPSMVANARTTSTTTATTASSSSTSWKQQQQQQTSDLSTYIETGTAADFDVDVDDDHIGQNVVVNDTDYDSILSSRSPTETLSASNNKPFSSSATTTATSVTSSSFSHSGGASNVNNHHNAAIDYNVSSSREAMLYNMRKHLRDSSVSDEKKLNA